MTSWKQWYLNLVVFLLPWQAVWIFENNPSQYLRLQFYAADILFLIAVVLFWPTVVVAVRRYAKVIGFVVGYFAVVSFFTVFPALAYLKLTTIILALGFTVVLTKHGRRAEILASLAASAVAQSGLALWQFATQHVASSTLLGMSEHFSWVRGDVVVETTSERWLRAYGTFPHPNILGTFLALGFLSAVEWYFQTYEAFQVWWNKQGIGRKALWREGVVRRTAFRVAIILISITLIAAGLFVSFSRSALLALGVSLAAYLAMKIYQNRIRGVMLGLKIVLIVGAVFWVGQTLYPGLWDARVNVTGRLEENSVNERTQGFTLALREFAAHPLLGTGLGQSTVVAEILEPGQAPVRYQPVHNVYALVVVEIGAIGLLFFLLTWRSTKRLAMYLYTEAPPLVVAVVVALAIVGLFDHFLFSLHAGIVIFALAIVLVRSDQK